MSKIKLVIKIDDENYKRIKDDVYDTHDIHRAIISIRKGTQLDDIKAEIDKQSDMRMDGEFYIRNIDVKRILSGNEVRP